MIFSIGMGIAFPWISLGYNMKPHFVIRFAGKGITPESFTLEDILSLLTELRAAFRDFGKADIPVSLVSITRQSAAYGFASSDLATANAALHGIVDSLSGTGVLNAGQSRVKAYFERVNRDKMCRTVFYAEGKTLLTYKKKAVPEAVSPVIKEHASATGKVVRVGGTGKPSAEMVGADGRKITAYGTENQIKELGRLLYQDVRVDGCLSTDDAAGTAKIDGIEAICSVERRGIADVFAELRERFGDKLGLGDKIDPVKYQRSIRG